MRSPATILLWTLATASVACSDDGAGRREAPPPPPREQALPEPVNEALPRPDHTDRYLEAHVARNLSGDLARATRLLQGVSSATSASRALRARARLRLAEMALLSGQRRQALAHLDQAREVAGPGHPLALEAGDRRARILVATPLATVRGPVPGSVQLGGEPRVVTARFAQAEKLLAAYHRVVVAPTLENINETLRFKRKSLTAALAAYHKVATAGGPAANGPCRSNVAMSVSPGRSRTASSERNTRSCHVPVAGAPPALPACHSSAKS